jgi:hypothetical protein
VLYQLSYVGEVGDGSDRLATYAAASGCASQAPG